MKYCDVFLDLMYKFLFAVIVHTTRFLKLKLTYINDSINEKIGGRQIGRPQQSYIHMFPQVSVEEICVSSTWKAQNLNSTELR